MLLLDVLERLMPSALTDPVSYTVRWDCWRWPIRGALIYSFIYKAVLGLLPSCTCCLLAGKRAARVSLAFCLFAQTEPGRRVFVCLAAERLGNEFNSL